MIAIFYSACFYVFWAETKASWINMVCNKYIDTWAEIKRMYEKLNRWRGKKKTITGKCVSRSQSINVEVERAKWRVWF